MNLIQEINEQFIQLARVNGARHGDLKELLPSELEELREHLKLIVENTKRANAILKSGETRFDLKLIA